MDPALTNGVLPPEQVERSETPDNRYPDDIMRDMEHLMKEQLLIMNKIFEQTTWLCIQVQAAMAALPPQLRPKG